MLLYDERVNLDMSPEYTGTEPLNGKYYLSGKQQILQNGTFLFYETHAVHRCYNDSLIGRDVLYISH